MQAHWVILGLYLLIGYAYWISILHEHRMFFEYKSVKEEWFSERPAVVSLARMFFAFVIIVFGWIFLYIGYLLNKEEIDKIRKYDLKETELF